MNGRSPRIFSGRQVDAEAAAAPFCRQADGVAAVAAGDVEDQGEAKAAAAAGLAAAGQAIEGLEDALSLRLRYARPVIGDFENGAASLDGDGGGDRASATVAAGILQEIADQPAQQQAVARDRDRPPRDGKIEAGGFLGRQRQEIDRLAMLEG